MVKKLEPGLTAEFTIRHRPSFSLPTASPIMHTRRSWVVEQAEGAWRMDWKTLLAYITGTVYQELLLLDPQVFLG